LHQASSAGLPKNSRIRGFVAGTHAGSLVSTFPSEARLQGIGSLTSLGNLIKAMVPHGGPERTEALAQLGAYGDGMARHAIDPFAQGKVIPGYIVAMHNRTGDGHR
jgi:hypothetical protein